MEGKQNVPPPVSTAAVLQTSKSFCYSNLVSNWDSTIFFSTKHSNVSSVWQNISITILGLLF